MPKLSVVSIRLSLIHLSAGFTLGGLILFHKGIRINPNLWYLLPAHIELLFFGWTTQLAIGVAFWILPRFAHGPKRGNTTLAWASVIALNVGVLSVGFAPLLPWPDRLTMVGRAVQLIAAVAFATHAWPRIRQPRH